jgi:hypothetical protein
MDINYFLLLQKKYKEMLENIDVVIEHFNEINDLSNEYVSSMDRYLHIIFDTEIHKNCFLEKRKQIVELKDMCKTYIQKYCNHEMVEDLIDITPDKSRTIIYCKLCEYCPLALSRLGYIYSEKA